MSGIAVVINRSGDPVPDAVIDPVVAACAHRGPDGVSVERAANVGLVHAALHATPESPLRTQPIQTSDGRWYCADLRIDNREELAADLRWTTPLAQTADIDLFVAANERWGRGLGDHIVGDFAAVVVDSDGRLTAWRDHLGVKPLYYWCSRDWIVVGSGMREVCAHPAAPDELDVQMMGEFLSGWVNDASATVVRGIRRVPAANVLTIIDETQVTSYWRTPLSDPIGAVDHHEYVDEFRATLREAVRCRLRAPGPVACQLSGGLDSTSIAAVATDLLSATNRGDQQLLAYSCVFPDSPRTDESSFIEYAVENLRLSWEAITLNHDHRWVDVDTAYWRDIPLPPDAPEHIALGKKAAARGCKVILTGQGGDNWFDVSPVAVAALLQGKEFSKAWSLSMRWSGNNTTEAARTIVKYGFLRWKPLWLRRPGVRRAPWVIGEARTAAGLDHRRNVGPSRERGVDFLSIWRRHTLADGYEAMTKEVLDRLAVLGGVEARHPYLDRRLVDLASRAPVIVHATEDVDRALQRAGLRGTLPDPIVDRRSKAAFNEVWYQEIGKQLNNNPAGTLPVEVGWLDGAEANELWRETTEVVQARRPGGKVLPLWGVVQVDALLRCFGEPS